MDDRKQRIVIDRAMPEGTRFFLGWKSADAAALDALAAQLEKHQVNVVAEPQVLADSRRVGGPISFRDPAGNRLEAFYGAEIDESSLPSPGRSISGFRTGPLGLGDRAGMQEKKTRPARNGAFPTEAETAAKFKIHVNEFFSYF